MSVAAANANYAMGTNSQGPAVAGQVLQASALTQVEIALVGTAYFIGDGSTASVTLNYIDGNNALSFTPTAILGVRTGPASNNAVTGGNAAAANSIVVQNIIDAANSNKTATVVFSAAPANNAAIQIAFVILK